MTSEEVLRWRRRRRKLRAMGRPQRVLPFEYERAQKIVRQASASGMTLTQMADQIGCNRTTLQPIIKGETRSMHRDLYNKILTLRPEPIQVGRTRHKGAHQDPSGTLRRFRALHALGFPASLLADFMRWDHPYGRYFLRATPAFVYASIASDVEKLYEKLKDADPEDHGVTPGRVRQARQRALARGYAPPSAWDEETIDDPEAIPQWTGACGTPEGRAIHRREGIPMCPACRSPRDGSFSYGVFDPEKMLAQQERRRLGRRELAEGAHLSPDTIGSYAMGTRVPPTSTLERLADALRCRPEDLCE